MLMFPKEQSPSIAIAMQDVLPPPRDVAWAVRSHPDFEAVTRREGWEIKTSDRLSYGTKKSRLTIKEQLKTHSLSSPLPGGLR
jgi:hypothetical protein